jgi:hypothetical protein
MASGTSANRALLVGEMGTPQGSLYTAAGRHDVSTAANNNLLKAELTVAS